VLLREGTVKVREGIYDDLASASMEPSHLSTPLADPVENSLFTSQGGDALG
jgi:hypothetical protein